MEGLRDRSSARRPGGEGEAGSSRLSPTLACAVHERGTVRPAMACAVPASRSTSSAASDAAMASTVTNAGAASAPRDAADWPGERHHLHPHSSLNECAVD